MYIIVWAMLVLYALLLAPGASTANDLLFKNLITGNFQQVDPLVVMVFSFLGLFPVLFMVMICKKDTYKLPGWPFSLLSFALGAFSLLFYYHWKGQKVRTRSRISSRFIAIISSRLGIGLCLALTIAGYVYGLSVGSIKAYGDAFMQSQLVSVMTADFFVLTWLSYSVMTKERIASRPYLLLCFIPVAGPFLVLLLLPRQDVREEKF
ncbi:hypothetical protein QJ133_11695 [Priestia megaterium]|uniref:hypothetical protein n=1 Tax=Priestia megaterium TaxID=1404 RepID=UPI00249A2716|nr:hypothetical protein [Priestia megaterium]MDI3091787.1 hypothetical protein [Priestia megaterium]